MDALTCISRLETDGLGNSTEIVNQLSAIMREQGSAFPVDLRDRAHFFARQKLGARNGWMAREVYLCCQPSTGELITLLQSENLYERQSGIASFRWGAPSWSQPEDQVPILAAILEIVEDTVFVKAGTGQELKRETNVAAMRACSQFELPPSLFARVAAALARNVSSSDFTLQQTALISLRDIGQRLKPKQRELFIAPALEAAVPLLGHVSKDLGLLALQIIRWAGKGAARLVPRITGQLPSISHRAVSNGCLKLLSNLAPADAFAATLAIAERDDGKRSFFVVEISVKPGGSRKHVAYVVATPAEVKQIIEKDLMEDPFLAISYGETLIVKEFEKNKLKRKIDLHPYVRFTFPAFDIAFKGTGEHADIVGFVPSDPNGLQEIDGVSGPGRDFYRFGQELACGTIRCQNVVIDLDLAGIGPLEGRALRPNEKSRVYQFGEKRILHYGRNDLENGD